MNTHSQDPISHAKSNTSPSVAWKEEVLSGWGRYPCLAAQSARPETTKAMQNALADRGDSPALAFGLGRSYGDVGLLENGKILHTRRLNRFLAFDPHTAWLKCEAGVSILDLVQTFLPKGFFPPVVPGTQFVTLGGAIANDIHGKNHHVDGTICDHIRNVSILTANGDIVVCDATQNADLWWTTVGGLGLTGVILDLEIKLQPVHGTGIEMESIQVKDLDHFFEVSAESSHFTHTVSWIDCVTKGSGMGRGIFMRGRHSESEPSPRLLGKLERSLSPLLKVPFNAPSFALNPLTIRAFNEVYYHKHPTELLKQTIHYEPFFFPLDFVKKWNRIYGKRGFLQYQLVVPYCPQHKAIRKVLESITTSGMGSFLAVIKEFGAHVHSGLSFPQPGVTLALDFPNYGDDLLDLLTRLDHIVMDAGGRVYLGKDARLPQAHFRQMYPEWAQWKEVRDQWDPQGVFSSALGQRLGLVD
jgi:decaprenylphospho-beta-D-ribofuranose 2-oxidase